MALQTKGGEVDPRRPFLERAERFGRWLFRPVRKSLSRQLLVLTVAFVMLGELLIFLPSIANFRLNYLDQRLNAAQIATLALEATPNNMLSPELRQELLANAQSYAVVLNRNSTRRLYLAQEMPPTVDAHFDLRDAGMLELILDALKVFLVRENRVIRVVGTPRFKAGEVIEIVANEGPLKRAMLKYGASIFLYSIVISVITAGLVFVSLNLFLVRPMRRITESMVGFRRQPEDASLIIEPSARVDEIGVAEQELAEMQRQIRSTLAQKRRLADLGSAVSKINHDLRNILASVQLNSDRLAMVEDPTVQRLSPRLLTSLDRAIELCTQTLQYGRAEEGAPKLRVLGLNALLEEAYLAASGPENELIYWRNDVAPDFTITADPEQAFRIFMNLFRNAVQAIVETDSVAQLGATAELLDNRVRVEVFDTGPGIPNEARENLFKAFSGSTRAGGSGLGLAIAAELVHAHGGTIELVESSVNGTRFAIEFPDRKSAASVK